MQIKLIDANNVLRREWEHVDPTKTRARVTYEEACLPGDMQVWVWDGFNHNARRREIYPDYKMKRLPMKEDMYSGLELMKEILSYSNAVQIEVPSWEADDVIATLARRYSGPDADIRISTNDLDYYQLGDIEGVTLNGVRSPAFPSEFICLYKTLVGDPSDNIPGLPGFGPKKFDVITSAWDELNRLFNKQDFKSIEEILGDVAPRFKLFFLDGGAEELYKYWQIVHMMEVPFEEIEKHTKIGTYNPDAAETLFTRFML